METAVCELRNISKHYGKISALSNVNLCLEKGHIYGFVGVNGAGKTTLMRIIAGLSRPTSGELVLFGARRNENEIETNRSRAGFIIETPSSYPNLSARKNLELACVLKGIKSKGVIDEVLRDVGLANAGNKPVRNFSLGMKQRLELAEAMLGSPDFLVLDEPMNGLDPIGIQEIRELLLKINRERQVTMLISSHILGELYQIATDYIFIDSGRIIHQTAHSELERQVREHIQITVTDMDKAQETLRHIGRVDYHVHDNTTLVLYDLLWQEKITTALSDNIIKVDRKPAMYSSVEEYFKKLLESFRVSTKY